MLSIAFDREGTITSDMRAIMCANSGTQRELSGPQGHPGAPLAERRIAIVNIKAMKCRNGAEAHGLVDDPAMLVEGCAMTSNFMLVYSGLAPAQAVTGVAPRDLY